MDNFIFYKKDTDLKSLVEKTRFSYTREYSMAFALDTNRLVEHLKKYPKAILYYFTNTLTNSDKITINNITNHYSDLKVCLCSNNIHAMDAWKMNLFHFLDHPVDNVKLLQAYHKYIEHEGSDSKEFLIKMRSGLYKIPFKTVNYLRAQGNYTFFELKGGKSFLETKQLHEYGFCIENDLRMKRVHRSFIINTRNIKTIGNKNIQFYATEKTLDISKALEMKIKRIILSK